MSAARRFYVYAVTLLSLEMVIWGVVGLLRTIFSRGLIGAGSLLATGLSFVLVGLPIFYFHWRTAQRDALAETQERTSRLRGIFLYGTLFALLIPIVSSLFAIINRVLVALIGLPSSAVWFGRNQSAVDNFIALVVLSLAFFYFWRVTRADEQAHLLETRLPETRRLFRYLWVMIGLTMTVAGVYNLLRFILTTPGARAEQAQLVLPNLAGGITLLLVGLPLWGLFWWAVQDAQAEPDERRSLLRLVVLYLISFASIIGVVAAAASVIQSLLRALLGEPVGGRVLLRENTPAIGLLIPLLVVWLYYGAIRAREVAALADQPRRAALGRVYFYLLSALGLGITFGGLYTLIEFLVLIAFGETQFAAAVGSISDSLSALLVGLPLWLIPWRRMQREALLRDDAGDHARRSLLRKIYLYLALFLLVIGAMSFAGQILYAVLNALLTTRFADTLPRQVTQLILWLALDGALLWYHYRALRADSRQSQQSLGQRHAAFPTLVIGEEDDFVRPLLEDLHRMAPRLPVALHSIQRGAPDETMLAVKAVVLPLELALAPSESLALWLDEYTGRRLIIPTMLQDTTLLGQVEKTPIQMAHEAARTIRQMAEGETLRQAPPTNPWVIVGYVLGALFGLLLLFFLFAMLSVWLFQ